jgi:hypothetical protein
MRELNSALAFFSPWEALAVALFALVGLELLARPDHALHQIDRRKTLVRRPDEQPLGFLLVAVDRRDLQALRALCGKGCLDGAAIGAGRFQLRLQDREIGQVLGLELLDQFADRRACVPLVMVSRRGAKNRGEFAQSLLRVERERPVPVRFGEQMEGAAMVARGIHLPTFPLLLNHLRDISLREVEQERAVSLFRGCEPCRAEVSLRLDDRRPVASGRCGAFRACRWRDGARGGAPDRIGVGRG